MDFFTGTIRHEKFAAGKKIWQRLETCLKEREISVKLLHNVAKNKMELSSLFMYLNEKTEESMRDFKKQQYLQAIENLVEQESDIRDKLSRLESAIQFAKKIDFAQIPRIFRDTKNNLETRKLKELNDEFWGPLLPLLKLSSELEPVMNSVSFQNVAMDFLSKNKESKSLRSDNIDTNRLQLLFLHLTEDVIPFFKSEWKMLCNSPKTQTFETMKILQGLRSEEDLAKELSILEYFLKPLTIPDILNNYMLDYVKYKRVFKQVGNMLRLLDVFELRNPDNDVVGNLTEFENKFHYDSSIQMHDLHYPMSKIQQIISHFLNENNDDVIDELGQSRELTTFLKEIVNIDVRFLIDAVEEHSDQFVSESLVSDLIHVHGFLVPVIETSQDDNSSQLPEEVLRKLKDQCQNYKDVAMKIRQCNQHIHSLKQLYYSVANRGEVTRDVIASCLKEGEVNVSLNKDGTCKIQMKYKRNNEEAIYSLSDLHDLRSRAHLIVSSDRQRKPTLGNDDLIEPSIDFNDFIEKVNLLCDIEELILKLRSSGHVKYQIIDEVTMTSTQELLRIKDNFFKELQTWEESLDKARKTHYFLNYYWSDQLCVLFNFLTNQNQTQADFHSVLTLIHFVDPNISEHILQDYLRNRDQHGTHDTPHEIISMIGEALDEIFKNTRPAKRTIIDQRNSSSSDQCIDSTVQPGELYIAALRKESTAHIINVVLSLYENTSNAHPERNQIIFCDPNKQWKEIQLLMQRCFTPKKDHEQRTLYCLANVELLENEVQFQLIDFIKENGKNNPDYLLAIICRGGDHHHIVEEFSNFSHHVCGMSYPDISRRFKSTWPDVKVVTSALPGLGKTEFIRQDALENDMNAVNVPITGQIDQNKIIQRLKELGLKDYQCLHFDIGEVGDPVLLDTFLFQLIVTGMVSSGTELYSLPSTRVYIEIANSLNDRLRKSLEITQCFTCHHLEWKNYGDLKVCSKITSDIQVVCNYLDVLERDGIELTDIRFSGQQKVTPLSENRCRELLRKYYNPPNAAITFTALNTFLSLLADQLRNFSKSSFFNTNNIKYMIGKKSNGVRRNLFDALLYVSIEFAARALKATSSTNHPNVAPSCGNSSTSAECMIKRVEGMIHWEESNHLLIVFHGNASQAITALYRKRENVPQKIADLLKNQIVKEEIKELDDFDTMNQDKLHEKLEKIARPKQGNREETSFQESDFSGYVLTPDNLLKMVLIVLRVRANIPVIIMGETGCGKTSLIKYLANTCKIPLHTFNIHAGRTEEEIKRFVNEKNEAANESPESSWVFLDEINTCDHLGLINDILCHHSMNGRPLATNLVFLAACNPYKKRQQDRILTTGLEINEMMIDDYSELVYRVHPLPEAMVDYVWDYGSLTPEDEKAYIQRMVKSSVLAHDDDFVNLLAESQKFIRKCEKNPFCVSLRDVHRCILLAKWFIDTIDKRAGNSASSKEYLKKYRELEKKFDDQPFIKSIILALAHCYLSRIETQEWRDLYLQVLSSTINISEEEISAIIRMEQEDYLERMELPDGTARNAALRENVFVMLVSILNRIPVFAVGKPGCSKSLAIQLIRSNLRGKDSKNRFFKTLPQLYVVSYQGSKSSTSEGINKIFEKASNYQKINKDANVLPVVLLDEVGLAEHSPNNPLKVLHSILEPGKGRLPDVAVVGISNWALDAAKMNRAIHLSRPEPTVKDLEETAISLYEANIKLSEDMDASTRNVLSCLANAYHEYQSKQGHFNFHGLRDYYSLVKSLRADSCHDMDKIGVALQRNFGGTNIESSNVQQIFIDKLKSHVPTNSKDISIPVTTLIKENLEDLNARHLMLITNGDSAIGILKQNLSQSGKETITIYGSRFEEDISDDYNYRMLSRIILCMERNCVLILRDLECIYGSLYDMLNQNYTVVGKRKNCRVALGANSNPMCYVNDGFRCIVLVDYDEVDYSDPPFLNRFEKQLLRFSGVLNEKQKEIIRELQLWACKMSSVKELDEQFTESDLFIGFHEDTLPSLVLLHSNDTDEPNEDIVKKCKDDLMWTASPDGVLRTQKCERLKENPRELKVLVDEYFEKPIHNGLASFLMHVLEDQEFIYTTGGEIGSKIIVMTYATVHTDITRCLNSLTIMYQLERLSAYNAEKQLEDRIHNFFFSSEKELLLFQCKPEFDSEHMLLARSIIEEKRNSYENKNKQRKHVCILVHARRGGELNAKHWQFNHLCGWKQVFLDILEEPPVPMNEIRSESVDRVLTSSNWSFEKFSNDSKCLLWCFNCIKYVKQKRSMETILDMAKRLLKSKKVFKTIQDIVKKNVRATTTDEKNESWLVKVACDKERLINSSTFSSTIEYYLCHLVREPLAKIIFFLERENAWPIEISPSDENSLEYENVWCELISRDTILDLSTIPPPLGTESYIVDSCRLNLSVPFSQVIVRQVNAAKEQVLKENQLYMDEIKEGNQIDHYTEIVQNIAPNVRDLPSWYYNLYSDDFLDITLALFSGNMERRRRISIGKCALLSYANEHKFASETCLHLCVQYHLLVWNFGQQIVHQIRMINSCEQFVNQAIADAQIARFLQKSKSLSDSRPFVNTSNFNESENETSTDEHGMEVESESEMTENVKPCLKRKSESQQDRNDSPKKKSKYQMGAKSDVIEVKSHSSTGKDCEPNSQGHTRKRKFSGDSNQNGNESSDSENTTDDGERSEEESDSDTSDSESSASEEETNEADCFEDTLVTKFCEEMFPSKMNIDKNGGLESWLRNSSLLLSLAFDVSNQTPAFHFLRLCVDYARMLVQTNTIQEEYLYKLDEIASKLKPEYLDKNGSLQLFLEKLVKPIKEKLEHGDQKYVVVQKFLATFYGRFIDTYDDLESAVPIVNDVFSMDRDDLVLLMRPVMYSLLNNCQIESNEIFFRIITSQAIENEHSILKGIDTVFQKRFTNGTMHHDSYPAVLVCDIIVSMLMFDERCFMENLTGSECELLKCVRCATQVLNANESEFGIVLLSSVAFLRVFYTHLSKHIYQKRYIPVMNDINAILEIGGTRGLSLQIFLLKQLYVAGMTMFDLHKRCCDGGQFPVLKINVEKSSNKVEFLSAYSLPEYMEVKSAYWHLTHKNETEMLTIMRTCQISANHRVALLGMLINTFFLKKAAGNLCNMEEENLANWFMDKSKDLLSPSKELLKRIIGREIFHHRGLQISEESSTAEIYTALLILHVSCVVGSRECETSPLYQYFSNPEKCQDTCILAHGENGKCRVFDRFRQCNEPSPITCSCELRIKDKVDLEQNACPLCGCTKTVSDGSEATSFHSITIRCLESKSKEWENCTANMDPPVYRALHLIVYACLYAGIATGISSNEAVSQLLNLANQGNTAQGSAADFCFNRVKEDLKCLMTILSCNSRTAVEVMHVVVEKCTDLIQGKSLRKDIFSTQEECLEWENEFTKIAKDVFPDALGSQKNLKMRRMKSSVNNQLLEKIEELDEYPFTLEQQNENLKRLLRVTKQPSFTELRSIFLQSPKDLQEQHRVLAILLSKFDELPYLTYLYPLLQWSRFVSLSLTHRLSRNDARSMNINDFIDGRLCQHMGTNQELKRKLFNDFKDAWKKMREFVNRNLNHDEMPALSEESPIGYCLTKGDLSIYLGTAIKILQSVQNNFLDQMILTSIRTRHPALSFLEKNESCCAITSISLDEAKETDIITFNWSNDFLRYAQKLEYGHGETIDYDFERMEIELTKEIVFGKRYLKNPLDTFIFSKELFHSSAKMLTRIRELCPQSRSLPDGIAQGIFSLKWKLQDAQNLLQYIEVLIFVLNMQSLPIQQDMTVKDFAEKWKSRIPSPFPVDLLPEPKASIQLAHITVLYEALEDLLADGTIEGLSSQFRIELTDEMKARLNSLEDSRNNSPKLKQLLTALRRFVFRYLSVEKLLPEPHTPLRCCLDEPSLWSPDKALDVDVIPNDMMLENIQATIRYLEKVSLLDSKLVNDKIYISQTVL